MNDVLSQLRKAGLWVWNQKEKMVLVALLAFLCFRVYVVLNPVSAEDLDAQPAPAKETTKKPPVAPPGGPAITSANVPEPPLRPQVQRAEDYKPLVRQNPFTIYGAMLGTNTRGEVAEETIDVTLNKIIKWRDGTYRAELMTKTARPKFYAEGEPFESYKLMDIDVTGNTVTIYSTAQEKTYTLKVPGS